jgi:hypothetical protein
MAFASIAVVALRQLTERLGASAGSMPRLQNLEVDPNDLRRANRHAWLALEISLSGQQIQEHLATFLSRTQATVFREQI